MFFCRSEYRNWYKQEMLWRNKRRYRLFSKQIDKKPAKNKGENNYILYVKCRRCWAYTFKDTTTQLSRYGRWLFLEIYFKRIGFIVTSNASLEKLRLRKYGWLKLTFTVAKRIFCFIFLATVDNVCYQPYQRRSFYLKDVDSEQTTRIVFKIAKFWYFPTFETKINSHQTRHNGANICGELAHPDWIV